MNAEPKRFERGVIMPVAVTAAVSGETFFVHLEGFTPPVLVESGDQEALLEIEHITRELWETHGPNNQLSTPPPLSMQTLSEENALAEARFERDSAIRGALMALSESDDAYVTFPSEAHPKLDRLKQLLARFPLSEPENEGAV